MIKLYFLLFDIILICIFIQYLYNFYYLSFINKSININYGVIFNHLWCCNYRTKYNSTFKSQYNEDKIVYENYFKNPTPYLNGIFIEIGALDGLKYSNSYFYEKSLGWKGLLVEGSSNNCKELKKNQNIRNRSEIVCAAICVGDSVVFVESDAIGGVENELPIRSWTNFSSNIKSTTKCIKLSSLINYYGITHIDIFFLDIEGSELTAIKTFDFNIIVYVWIIEFNNKSSDEHQHIQSILYNNGYVDCKLYVGKKNKCFINKLYKAQVNKYIMLESKYLNNNGKIC